MFICIPAKCEFIVGDAVQSAESEINALYWCVLVVLKLGGHQGTKSTCSVNATSGGDQSQNYFRVVGFGGVVH
jgi:hypothetical protein